MYTGIIIRTLHRTRSVLFLGARLTKLRSTLTNGSRLREWWRAREKRPNAGKIALAQCKFAPYLAAMPLIPVVSRLVKAAAC